MEAPDIQYTRSGDVAIAYQVLGDGPAMVRVGRSSVRTLAQEVGSLGLQIRAGLHTGECELMGKKPSGIAVAIGARVAAEAQPGEVLVSSTVKDLVAGSEITFEDRGLTS